MNYYLAVDLGASSGRHIIGHVENKEIIFEEIHRFDNTLIEKNGSLCWDYEKLFDEICIGMTKCKEAGKIPRTMAIDTWGVDYVLLDEQDRVIGETIAYRDSRTNGMDEVVAGIISPEELYARTGIQKAIFNTIYQLTATQKKHPEQLDRAKTLLFVPEYFDFLLTGSKGCEYTIASTSQLLAADKYDWDYELLDRLSFPREIFPKISLPGTSAGHLRQEIAERVGYTCEVLMAPAHDTASAVLAVPVSDNRETIYISSGTWSLMGIERDKPDLSEKSRLHNFTNEGGYNRRFRYLKNIMGLWMIQSVRNELSEKISFAELCKLAEKESAYPGRIDVNDDRFLAPKCMTEEVKLALKEQGAPEISNIGELASCIYRSLAEKYSETVCEIEEMTGKKYDSINIVGGGCNAEYLNRLTEEATGRKVYSGPSEATAIGNLLSQMLTKDEYGSVNEARSSLMSLCR